MADQIGISRGRHRWSGKGAKLIVRIWHGWTKLEDADAYEALLEEEIFVGIQDRRIHGFEGIQLLRREVGGEVEFVTIMRFSSLAAVREFAGDDYEAAVVPRRPGRYCCASTHGLSTTS